MWLIAANCGSVVHGHQMKTRLSAAFREINLRGATRKQPQVTNDDECDWNCAQIRWNKSTPYFGLIVLQCNNTVVLLLLLLAIIADASGKKNNSKTTAGIIGRFIYRRLRDIFLFRQSRIETNTGSHHELLHQLLWRNFLAVIIILIPCNYKNLEKESMLRWKWNSVGRKTKDETVGTIIIS